MDTLTGPAMRAAVEEFAEKVGARTEDAARLLRLIPLADDAGRLRLSECLQTIFPGDLAAFTAFRSRVNVKGRPFDLALEVDSFKKSPPNERFCWFAGPDRTAEHAEAFSVQATRTAENVNFIPTRGVDPSKRQVKIFVSYKSEEKELVNQLLDELKQHFGSSKKYELQYWMDVDCIRLGELWHPAIQGGLRECDYGLLMMSAAFLGSNYILKHELPALLERNIVLPVALRQWHKSADLHGIGEHQIFWHGKKAFKECRDKDGFVLALYERIIQRLEHEPPNPPVEEWIKAPSFECEQFTRTRGVLGFQKQRINPDAEPEGRDALKVLTEWATDPQSFPLFALLGEYGIGKTTTLRKFTRDLLERRKTKPETPLPIYIDLREHRGAGVPSLDELLQAVIKQWGQRSIRLTPEDLRRLVEEGALIIFDGLDEKTVHLNQQEAQQFIRNLWGILPDLARTSGVKGKMLVSCRSHYFRDLANQHALLAGEDREGIAGDRYPALDLLPFSSLQIRDYLTAALGGEAVDSTLELLNAVHNLNDLAKRPYLLKLIVGHLDELRLLRARGETVNAARLYELFVETWLSRDLGKHQIDQAYKRDLMEELAAELWRSGKEKWTAARLEKWLDGYLAAHPAMAQAMDRPRAVLKEDLRTATFLVRPNAAEKHFRFAHSSLHEFFLASYLVRALRERRPEAWNLPMPSVETLDFVGQLLELDADGLETLDQVAQSAQLPAARLALRYCLRAAEKKMPTAQPTCWKLPDADLMGWMIRGVSLRGADLQSAQLSGARLEDVDLSGADMSGASMRNAVLVNVLAPRAVAGYADWSEVRWRGGSLREAHLATALLAGCQWIGVDLAGARLPMDWDEEASLAGVAPVVPRGETVWKVDQDERSAVDTCAWSPDGRRVLTGSWDSTLKIRDADSGVCLRTLSGHANAVLACAWSPDGRHVISCSEDLTMKQWDAETGACLRTFSAHAERVNACAWSPDGRSMLSGSDDSTLRLWDANSGSCLRTLSGHASSVLTCAWSPDGQRVLSGSDDSTLKLWDVDTGACLRTLSNHARGVGACGWSPDGRHVVSGSDDSILKLWDANTGACVRTLSGHGSAVWACAWSPDGRRLLSSSRDWTLKLWDVETGVRIRTLAGRGSGVIACSWTANGSLALSASVDGTLAVWDPETGTCLHSAHHLPENATATFTGDELTHTTGEAWRWLGFLWRDPRTGRERLLPAEHFGPLPH